MDMKYLVHLMLLSLIREKSFLIFPFAGLLLFCGSSCGSSDFVLHSMCVRSHSPLFWIVFYWLRVRLLAKSSLLSLWVLELIFGRLAFCCLFVTWVHIIHVKGTLPTDILPFLCGNGGIARVEDSDRESLDPTTVSWIKLRWTSVCLWRLPFRHDTGNGVDSMIVFIDLIEFNDYFLPTSCLVMGTLVFLPTREKYEELFMFV